MKRFCFLLVLQCCIACLCAQVPLAKWSFESRTASVHTTRPGDQRVEGIKGKGLRTDGYSTYVSEKIKRVGAPLSISGWFAPESYPTDTAGLFAVEDTITGIYLGAAVDRFGTVLLVTGAGNQYRYTGSKLHMERFAWNHVQLTIERGSAALYINGKKVCSQDVQSLPETRFGQVLIGRDKRQKTVGIFPVTFFNGIIDEVVLSREPVRFNSPQVTPDLAVPREWFEKDFNRPAFHLLPAANWTNETHGLFFKNGRYHIFNQKNATNVFLGQINWGHFSSPDLVNWTEHIPALTPEPGYDERGVWSGHVVIQNDTPFIIYTGGGRDTFHMCLAYPLDSQLVTWEKYPGNPVVSGPPPGFTRNDPHDPYVWREGNKWYMIIGFGVIENNKKKGTAILYVSEDLRNWNYVDEFFRGDPDNDGSGDFWEMPVVWKFDERYVFLVNKVPSSEGPAEALYWTGTLRNYRFVPDHQVPHKLEVINRLLSPSVATDENGRTTAIAIIPDETTAEAQYKQGWTHLYSIPRIWKLVDGKIAQTPHPSLKQLRQTPNKVGAFELRSNSSYVISRNHQQLEVQSTVIIPEAGAFGFNVYRHPRGSEVSRIIFDIDRDSIYVDQSKSTTRPGIPLNKKSGAFDFTPGKELKITMFIDGSVLEMFLDDHAALTTRVFPQFEESNLIEWFTEKNKLKIEACESWPLKPARVKTQFKLPSAMAK